MSQVRLFKSGTGAAGWHGLIALLIAGLLLGDAEMDYTAVTRTVIVVPLNTIFIIVLAHNSEAESDL